LVDFKHAGTKRTNQPVKEDEKKDYPFLIIQQAMGKNKDMDIFNQENDQHVQSVYPFLDVCSKLITDIV
jgi:carbon catabolite-derepressing protein kinase